MAVNVKKADRRQLRFASLDDILADAEAVTAGGAVTPAVTGNWTAAQNIHHVAFTVRISSRGADFRIPLPIRMVGRALKFVGVHTRPIKPGVNPPAKIAAAFAPPPDISIADAWQKLRDEITYAKEHGMTHPSPLFGKLSHDDWIKAHCRHAELHFGFIRPAA